MLPLPCIVLPLLKKRQWVLAGAVQVLVQDAAIFNQCHHCPSCSRRQHWLLAGLMMQSATYAQDTSQLKRSS